MKLLKFIFCVFLFLLARGFIYGENLPRVTHLEVLDPQLDSICECMLVHEYGDRLINKKDLFLVLFIKEKNPMTFKIEGMVLGGRYKRQDYNEFYVRFKCRPGEKLLGYFFYKEYPILVYSASSLEKLFVRQDYTRMFSFMELYPEIPLKPGEIPPPPVWEPFIYCFTLDQNDFSLDDIIR